MEPLTETRLIAPCGMNCSICRAYLRKRNKCTGCRGENKNKPISRVTCKIKTCEILAKNSFSFCFACDSFPCPEINRLDKRYRTKYFMSMVENLENIKEIGLEKFLENEKIRWACPECGGTICVHTGECSCCGAPLAALHEI